jgi:AcrR family transcriptional regulator
VTSDTDRYHHGDLPNALRHAAVDVINERGLGAFSLREVARRAGVSHTAPAHHFGDMQGLLTSLATEGFEQLGNELSAARASGGTPAEQLEAIGRAYVSAALTHPAHCSVMFRTDLVDLDDLPLQEAGQCAYTELEDTVRSLLESERLGVDLDTATWMCWSTMQGLVEILPKLMRISEVRGIEPVPVDELIRRFTDMIIAGWRSHDR